MITCVFFLLFFVNFFVSFFFFCGQKKVWETTHVWLINWLVDYWMDCIYNVMKCRLLHLRNEMKKWKKKITWICVCVCVCIWRGVFGLLHLCLFDEWLWYGSCDVVGVRACVFDLEWLWYGSCGVVLMCVRVCGRACVCVCRHMSLLRCWIHHRHVSIDSTHTHTHTHTQRHTCTVNKSGEERKRAGLFRDSKSNSPVRFSYETDEISLTSALFLTPFRVCILKLINL